VPVLAQLGGGTALDNINEWMKKCRYQREGGLLVKQRRRVQRS
jgi:hypothetical protein